MSKPPMNKVTQSWSYLRDKCCHKFWDPANLALEEDIKGRIVIVTGCNTGIGKETVIQLGKRGAKIIMACRNLEKATEAKDYILEKVPTADLVIMQLDLGDLTSIRKFVSDFEMEYDALHILVNNAGVLETDGKLHKTKDGFEYHVGINHLGSFLLTRLLIPSLLKGAPSKIVCVSSSQICLASLHLEDIMMETGVREGSDGLGPYNESKLESALCIRHLASSSSLGENNNSIRVFQLCPGLVASDVFRSDTGMFKYIRKVMMVVAGLSPENGAETVVFCAVNKKLATEPDLGKGEMYRFTHPYPDGTSFLDPQDPKAIELYKMSEKLVGLTQS